MKEGRCLLCGRARSYNLAGVTPAPEGRPTTGQQVLGGPLVTAGFKRRTASRQAVSRKVEGNEPRNAFVGKDDTLVIVEVNMSIAATGKAMLASSGSKTMACLTLRLCGNPGGPAPLSARGVCRTNRRGSKANRFSRESDGSVVPMMAGNAAGGKGATYGSAK